ncbi:hypothetical protein [Moraxella sp. K2450]|uniref:hypothetical protein n=1 Tax=Moraxella sp. K2450 TaxID=2780076 RepID=UPI001882104B|nr:hypothetical protein [Moraxella sp. K2450]MBE9597410.1 hypothetical protein [Moraxella sp. K2450]
MTDIRDNVAVGRTMALEKTINYKGWKGSGYIIIDPQTGSGAYLIDGGNNGGGWAALYNALGILLQFFSYVADFSSKLLQIAQYSNELKGAISVLDDVLGKYFVVARFTQTIGGILLAES